MIYTKNFERSSCFERKFKAENKNALKFASKKSPKFQKVIAGITRMSQKLWPKNDGQVVRKFNITSNL